MHKLWSVMRIKLSTENIVDSNIGTTNNNTEQKQQQQKQHQQQQQQI